MPEAWPDADDELDRLVKEAALTAKQLGHKLVGWVIGERSARSRCISCDGAAVVKASSFSSAPLSGPGLTLRCERRR